MLSVGLADGLPLELSERVAKPRRSLLRALAALVVGFTSSSCSTEIEYMAKFCSGNEIALYVREDFTTLTAVPPLSNETTDRKILEEGEISVSEANEYVEYSGTFNFTLRRSEFRSGQSNGVEGDLREGRSIFGKFDNENSLELFIDDSGHLLRFDEFVEVEGGAPIVVGWELCGGRLPLL